MAFDIQAMRERLKQSMTEEVGQPEPECTCRFCRWKRGKPDTDCSDAKFARKLLEDFEKECEEDQARIEEAYRNMRT